MKREMTFVEAARYSVYLYSVVYEDLELVGSGMELVRKTYGYPIRSINW